MQKATILCCSLEVLLFGSWIHLRHPNMVQWGLVYIAVVELLVYFCLLMLTIITISSYVRDRHRNWVTLIAQVIGLGLPFVFYGSPLTNSYFIN